ncbi:hypothetical protein [Plebeiibacterium marinum]|uniref:IPT/TIG domain-containing protein n=1 Tax=Plebeiibacterium marinum TaxID=2992111 RepID=A0AAE3MEY6_9BACT|nr:hypothetical protein [Plebeiobacterium marinum]MCW3806367.1 hypothetical protein [Plebeiobacterium marinum]
MKKTKYINKIESAILVFFIGLFGLTLTLTSCEDDDDGVSNETELLSYGPMPIQRGAELRFIGNNLDDVTSIIIPDGIELTSADFTEHTAKSIKLIVPQEAIEGLLVLNYSEGTITTQTPIGFSEPISLEAFAVSSIKPGAELTLTGDYLNRVAEVIFTDRVVVDSVDFVSKSRKEIKLIVPAEAQTGKIAVSNGAEDPIIIYSEEELNIVIPVVSEVTPNPVKPGTALTITGTDLDLVTGFALGGDVNVTEFESQSATSIVMTVPTNAKSGAVTSVLPSGIEIEVGDIALIEPTAAIDEIKDSYGVGEMVVFAGTDLDLVTTATFTGAEATPVTITDGKINLEVSEAAQSGAITLATANGTAITVDGFVTTKPVATFPSDATPLDELSIVSTLGGRVKSVMFGDLEAEATASGDGFNVVVPLEAETGSVTMVMDNGETVAAGSITINTFTFCAVSEFASESTTVGELLECAVVNGENLTNVLLNDQDTPYLLVGTVLYAAVGTNVGDNKITLVSGTTNVDYTIKVEASGLVETVLYNTPVELTNWSANYELNVDFSGAPADSYVRIRYTKTNDNPQMKIFHGHWGNVYDGTTDENLAILASSDYIDLPVSLFPFSDWGYSIILQGDGMIISSISWVKDFSAPKPIWEGLFDLGNWQGNQDLAWGNYDWSTVTAGQTLYFSFTMNEGNDWGCLSLRHGDSWGNLPTEGSGQIDFGPSDTQATYTLTQADIDDLVANGGLVITGANLTLTKVALK